MSDQRWSCHSCGHCCRTLVIHLSEHDRLEIDRQAWEDRLGNVPYVRAGRGFVLNKRPDGACVFLTADNRCRIHAEYGEHAKPLACRVFPFSVRPVAGGWQASLRFDCPSVAASKGAALDGARAWLSALVARLDHNPPLDEDAVDLKRGVRATATELNALSGTLTSWLTRDDVPMLDKLIACARITAVLAEANLDKVRDDRFAELIDLLFGSAPTQFANVPSRPTDRQRGMLRQLVFAHAEHVSLAQLRSGVGGRLRTRCHQLVSGLRFLRGRGAVPRLPDVTGGVAFDAVEAVASCSLVHTGVEDLLTRYVAGRLSSGSAFGHGYYRWSVFNGLTALWLSLAAAGWLARYHAASASRSSIELGDFASALGIVDRAATRLPALGVVSETVRAT
ncbi:MAG: YkgJ family cysteine cluster protein, partial [Phycisphaerae bacterium]